MILIVTSLESAIVSENLKDNLEYLESHEVAVYLNVDSTKLHEHKHVREKQYSKVLFNFPHVKGKANIKNERELLKKTFESVKHLVDINAEMMVTLCEGQGGTPGDVQDKSYEESWQVAEMAAFGDFILIGVEPFVPENFPDYSNVGAGDAGSDASKAVVHIFRKMEPAYTAVIDNHTYIERLQSDDVTTKLGTVHAPVLYTELYKMSLAQGKHSSVGYLSNIMMKELKKAVKNEKDILVATDDDIPLHVEYGGGVMCKVDDCDEYVRLRSSAPQIFEFALRKWEEEKPNFLFFSGVYFAPISGKDLHSEPPVIHQFLLLGKSVGAYGYRYIAKLTKLFVSDSIQCMLRPQMIRENVVALARDTVKDLNAFATNFKGKLATEWVYISKDHSWPNIVVSHVYTLEYNGHTLDACIIYPDVIAAKLFNSESWRELWTTNSSVRFVEVENGLEKPVLKQKLLYPMSFILDITLKIKGEFPEDDFYNILWLAAGLIVYDVQMIKTWQAEGHTFVSYSVTYKSIDKPINRSKVTDIHKNVLGKMLETALGVKVVEEKEEY